MKFIFTSAIISLLFFSVSETMAASDKCVVVKSEGRVVTLECKKNTDSFQTGAEVKIKSSRKAAIEGC